MGFPSIAVIRSFVIFYGIALLVQFASSYFTFHGITGWYSLLNKSPYTPPDQYFGIVWTALYFLMSLAATMIWERHVKWNNAPLRWWFIQLITGLIWCMVFFGMHEIEGGFYVICFEWFAVLVAMRAFWHIDRTPGLLMLPLFLWVSFATYLNYYIWQNNNAHVTQLILH